MAAMIEEANIIQDEPFDDSENLTDRAVDRPRPDQEDRWQDRVRLATTSRHGAGRQRNEDWSNSVLRYVKPYVHKIGWKTQIVCREVLATMRLFADRHPEVAKVIEKWDTYTPKQKTRIFSIDQACFDVDADRDEFAGLVLAAVSKHIQRNGIAIIDQNFERIIQAAVDHAVNGGAKGAAERVTLIKLLTQDQVKPKPVTKTEVAPTQPPEPEAGQAPSLDRQLAELDDIESIGVE